MKESVYCVFRNNDLCEGIGPMVLTHICRDKKLAESIAKDMEPYGHCGQFCEVKLIEITTSYVTKAEKAIVADRAMQKLSYEEKVALGLIKEK